MSTRYKTKEVKVIDKILCDMCGSECLNNHADLFANFDNGFYFDINLCKKCFYHTIDWIKKIRNPSIYTNSNDPLQGVNGEVKNNKEESWSIRFK